MRGQLRLAPTSQMAATRPVEPESHTLGFGAATMAQGPFGHGFGDVGQAGNGEWVEADRTKDP